MTAVPQEMIDRYDAVVANADLTKSAADQFIAEAGYPPEDVNGDETPSGRDLMEFLPGAWLLVNPYTQVATEPQDGLGLAIQGGTGYLGSAWSVHSEGATRYDVEGYGENLVVIVRRTHDSLEDRWTRARMIDLQWAVETFATGSGGRYPHDVDVDETPAGDTVLDIFAPYALANPYVYPDPHRCGSCPPVLPHDGLASGRGEIGYLPVEDSGSVVGYVINGGGLFGEFGRIEKSPTP